MVSRLLRVEKQKETAARGLRTLRQKWGQKIRRSESKRESWNNIRRFLPFLSLFIILSLSCVHHAFFSSSPHSPFILVHGVSESRDGEYEREGERRKVNGRYRYTIGRVQGGQQLERVSTATDVGNYMTKRLRKIRDKHSRQPQQPRFNINADSSAPRRAAPALITLYCASLAPSVIYMPSPHHRPSVMHTPIRISNVSVATEVGTTSIQRDRDGRAGRYRDAAAEFLNFDRSFRVDQL